MIYPEERQRSSSPVVWGRQVLRTRSGPSGGNDDQTAVDTGGCGQKHSGKSSVARWRGPLFIVGMPRSGTKLLRSLLNGHSKIGIPDVETEFLLLWQANWVSYGDLSQRHNFEAFFDRAVELPFFHYRRAQGNQIDCTEWYSACESYDVAGVFEALMRLELNNDGRPGDVIWGDKSPGYLLHIDSIKQLFPEARFVHIVRDVRDYCLSINHAWHKNMLRAAQRWADGMEQVAYSNVAKNGDYLEIRYEDLLADSAATLSQVCGFAGVEFEANMQTLVQPSENIGAARSYCGVKKDNANKYLTQMSASRRVAIERIACEGLKRYGYPLDYSGPARRLSTVRLQFLRLSDGAGLLRAGLKRHRARDFVKLVLGFLKINRSKELAR